MHFLQHNWNIILLQAPSQCLIWSLFVQLVVNEGKRHAFNTIFFSFVLDNTLLDNFSNGKVILNLLQPNRLQ